jgi:uncharacterized membrane protein YkvA (DUF1232 family)
MQRTGVKAKWKQKTNLLKIELLALYLAYRHPKTPWYAKVCMAIVLGYAISPIDLIPDFIPVLGYLDDLIIIPAGIYLTVRMVPRGVMQECRDKARSSQFSTRAKWIVAGIIIAIWILVIFLAVKFIRQAFF